MKYPSSAGYWTGEWQVLPGLTVEVWLGRQFYRGALVDDAMPDSSGVWLATEGPYGREYVDKDRGYMIWRPLHPVPLVTGDECDHGFPGRKLGSPALEYEKSEANKNHHCPRPGKRSIRKPQQRSQAHS
jgi:hypothetical protein